jgi:hypothetical protein
MWDMLPHFLLIIGFMAAILHIMFRIEKLDMEHQVFLSANQNLQY